MELLVRFIPMFLLMSGSVQSTDQRIHKFPLESGNERCTEQRGTLRCDNETCVNNNVNWTHNFITVIISILILTGTLSASPKLGIDREILDEKFIFTSSKLSKEKVATNDYMHDVMDFLSGFGPLSPPHIEITVSTGARYPDDHNCLLPLKLIKQLDMMNPKEFLKYVLEELTLEERESLMIDERQRRRTFQVGWPYENNLSGVKMAQAGFYSVDDYDRVQCVFCRGSLHHWERGDTPKLEHARSFNFCRFVRGLNCGNREFKPDKLTKEDMKNITSFPSADTAQSIDGMVDSSIYGISANRAAMIEYAIHESRMRTFSRWPKNAPIPASLLCDAGLYFTGFDDMVRCFNCAGAIREWTTTDDPYVEHARWFPDCSYLIQLKTQEFIDEVHATTPANKKTVIKTNAQITATKKKDRLMSDQEEMYQLCLTLGHSEESIQKAFENNGGPFEKVTAMIDAIYNAESGRNSPLRGNWAQPMATECSEDLQDVYPHPPSRFQLGSTSQAVGVSNGTERQRTYPLGCRSCETRTGQYVPATHIGLPCGHVNFCDQCNDNEKFMSIADPNDRARCAILTVGHL